MPRRTMIVRAPGLGVRLGLFIALLLAAGAHAQLAPREVLVVYDSRIADSRLVAEHYAGSAKVPGGVGGVAPARPGVRVVDLASLGAPAPTGATLSYANFKTRLRDPIANYLRDENLTRAVRSLVLTKGIAHRVQDIASANVGDAPASAANLYLQGNATYASVDSELTLVLQTLDDGESGGSGDSFADGNIVNPYHRSNEQIAAFSRAAAGEPIRLIPVIPGQIWRGALPAGGAPAGLTPGQMLLVSRLDGHTVDDVRAMIDRAQHVVLDPGSSAIVLDESGSNGVADAGPNNELDNRGISIIRAGDDYEMTRDHLLADGRWNPAMIRYDEASGASRFLVGPRLDYNNEGLLVEDPVVLLAHYGSNHAGAKPGGTAGRTYPESFHYAPGAVFNTIESYNARAFNGLGSTLGQAQAADFLAAGGTFAIGHVWEPFADFIPDNDFLVRNFLLGHLSWAEAAWTSIPVLSWQHVVLGDPLARVVRTSEDLNGDGRVDIDDLYEWYRLGGVDINNDGVIDEADKQLLIEAIRFGETLEQRESARP
ncbi:MAG: hypothetical protein EA378_11530 [Phycisphaerales bacterium]|nr:MAG: hypothetical protein EA378_11530 [Phycisphaerales bacterium]